MSENTEKKPLVLAVDDNMKNLQLIANVLQNNGYETAVATNGNEAIHYFKSESADLILLDIMMPDIDGFEVCGQLKSNPETRSIPIIFLTAKNDTESIVKAFKHGGVDYLIKPFNEAELIARVNTQIQLKQSQDKLKKSEQTLKELNETKDRFFSIIAHDLKNPLMALINLSEALLDADKNKKENISGLIEMLHEIVMNQYKLLENLLEWSSLQTKRRKTYKEQINIIEIVNEIFTLYSPIAENKSISLSITDNNQSHLAYADEKMIETVLRNLLSNAIKFTPENGNITVLLNGNKDNLLIKVIDNGIGIKKENFGKIFDIGKTHSTTGTNNEEGSGLGLLLCKELTERNNGYISVESEPGKGSTFTVALPKNENHIKN